MSIGFGGTAYVVSQWRSHLYLQRGHVAHGKAEDSTDAHGEPEVGTRAERERIVKRDYFAVFAKNEDHRQEDEACVEIIVNGQLPDVVVNGVK